MIKKILDKLKIGYKSEDIDGVLKYSFEYEVDDENFPIIIFYDADNCYVKISGLALYTEEEDIKDEEDYVIFKYCNELNKHELFGSYAYDENMILYIISLFVDKKTRLKENQFITYLAYLSISVSKARKLFISGEKHEEEN